MYEFGLKNFRGFRDLGLVEIRPLTLLVGENSAGKSSFLAGLKYVIDFAVGSDEPSFNRDPFQLGTFQQIAHYRGGKAGRSHEFQLTIRQLVGPSSRSPKRDEKNVALTIIFENVESQAVISAVSIDIDNEKLLLRLDNDQTNLSYVSETNESFAIQGSDSFPRVPRTEFGRYWPYLMRDLRFRVRRQSGSDSPTLFPPQVENRAALLAEYADHLSGLVAGPLLATSPIRTRPLRTYTPGFESRDAEGSHVPYEMAKLYRAKNKEAWRRLKDSLEAFGSSSDMFSEVNIKSFGKTPSDPFQIQFSHNGPKTNIVDLGYGTSQILPILYDISTIQRRSKIFIQQPEVHLHPRAQAALGSYVVNAYKRDGKQFILETHSDFIVDRIRNAVTKGDVSSNDISILFFERKKLETVVRQIFVDKEGQPINPPEDYRRFFIDEQMRALGLSE